MGKRLLILSDAIGSGDETLGRTLMKDFLYSLARAEVKPDAVMLGHGGVRLACKGSESIDDLKLLEDAGVMVRACTTCLRFYGLLDKVAVGEAGTMPGMVEAVVGPDEVVTIC